MNANIIKLFVLVCLYPNSSEITNRGWNISEYKLFIFNTYVISFL